jgi:hypothetical protein
MPRAGRKGIDECFRMPRASEPLMLCRPTQPAGRFVPTLRTGLRCLTGHRRACALSIRLLGTKADGIAESVVERRTRVPPTVVTQSGGTERREAKRQMIRGDNSRYVPFMPRTPPRPVPAEPEYVSADPRCQCPSGIFALPERCFHLSIYHHYSGRGPRGQADLDLLLAFVRPGGSMRGGPARRSRRARGDLQTIQRSLSWHKRTSA